MKRIFLASLALTIITILSTQAFSQSTDKMINIYVLHGYYASTDDHWFQSLKAHIEDKNIQVTLISFPDSKNPNLEKWQQTLEKSITKIDQNTYFIAHSLGVITLLSFLERHKNQKMGGMILVSGFSKTIEVLPQLDAFILKSQIDFTQFVQLKKKYMFISNNDSIVPTQFSVELANQLNSSYSVIQDSGHFLASDGYVEFPQLEQCLKQMLLK